jgi:hypothetical protein
MRGGSVTLDVSSIDLQVQMSPAIRTHRLLTIPASMYCEKARWALGVCRYAGKRSSGSIGAPERPCSGARYSPWPFRSFSKPRVARTLTRCARAAQPRTLRVSLVCPTVMFPHLHLPETRSVTILAALFAPRTGWRTRRREACQSSTTVERVRQVLATVWAQ